MEASPERPRPLVGGTIPPDHQLPSGVNKLERIAQHSKGLVEDVTSWVELKLKLTKLEVMHEIEAKGAEALVKALPMVVFALAGLFLLVTLALFIGWALGHPAWGFLIVTALLALAGYALKRMSPSLARRMAKEPHASVAADHVLPVDGRQPNPQR